MMSDQQVYIVLLSFLGIMGLQYVLFYLKGISMKIPFLMVTLLVIVGIIIPTEESVIYSVFTLLLFVWMGMVPLGLWKGFTYKSTLVKKIKLASIAPTDKHVKRLAQHIHNRRIKLEWLLSKDERLVDSLGQLYRHCENSRIIDSDTQLFFERVLIQNGFEIVIKSVYTED